MKHGHAHGHQTRHW